MFCPYCGKPLAENEVCTCPGARQHAAKHQPAAIKAAAGQAAVQGGNPLKPAALILAVLLMLSAAAMVLAFILNSTRTKIDLKPYVQCSVSGLDTMGQAAVAFDWDAFSTDFPDADVLGIDFSFSPQSNLSNGDVVKVTLTYNKDAADDARINVTNTKLNYTVSGLEEAPAVDLFAGLEISFEGVAPDAILVLKNTSEDDFLRNVSYSANVESGFSNGDSVTITAHYSAEAALQAGVRAESDTKTVVLENVPSYVTSSDQISQDAINAMTQQSKDVIYTKMVDDYNNFYAYAAYGEYKSVKANSIVFSEENLITSYLCVPKSGAETKYYNKFIQVFQITSTSNVDNGDPVTFYYAVCYYNLSAGGGTTYVNLSDYGDTYGNPNTQSVYNEVVAPLLATYTVTQF